MPVFQWDSSYSSENSRRYQKMKFRRDRRKGGDNIPIIDDGVKFSPSAEHKVFALCNLIRSNAAYLQRMGQKQFYEKERWVESELPELCEFFSKAQWVIREESLAMAARWVKIPLADIDTSEFFRIIRLRIKRAIQGDILREGTQSWQDWRQAEEDPRKCRSTWAGDYTKKAIRWLATQVLKIDAGENDDEDEDETQCELYKYYFIRLKRKLATVSLVKRLKEELGRPNLEVIMLGDPEETEESEEKKRARTWAAVRRWEEKRAAEEEEWKQWQQQRQQQQRRQKPKKPNSSIMRTLASERVKREEELEAVKVKQQQDHEAALQRTLQEEEEQKRQTEKRQTETRKMERRRKKKEERRLRKVEPAKWQQKKEWLQKEKTGQLGYCQFCGEKATIVCRECYDVGLCMASDGCAKTHRQKCSTYYVHEGNEVD